jgi:hypothetical protein
MTTSLQFTDKFTATITELLNTKIYLQNVWTRDDFGGETLYNFSAGTTNDQTFFIPATVFPRFSSNDSLNSFQTPYGTDPASVDLTDGNNDGIPDSEEPWSGLPGYKSHQLGSDQIPVDVPAISVSRIITSVTQGSTPLSVTFNYDLAIVIENIKGVFNFGDTAPELHVAGALFNGSMTLLTTTSFLLKDVHLIAPVPEYTLQTTDEVYALVTEAQASGSAYLPMIAAYANFAIPAPPVNAIYRQTGRYAVPFHTGSRVRVNGEYMAYGVEYVVDHTRSFIQFMPGRAPGPTDHLDINYFISDKLFFKYAAPFNASMLDTDPRDSFIITVDSTQPTGYTLSFTNSDGVANKATLKEISFGSGVMNGTQFQVTALTPIYFQVQQIAPTLGPLTYASFNIAYTSSSLNFRVDADWVSYYLTVDDNAYNTFTLNLALFTEISQIDPTDYLPDLSIPTQRGYILEDYDTAAQIHNGMQFSSYGKVILKDVTVDTGTYKMYAFIFDDIPPLNTYIEFRIEQAGQYNQIANASFMEHFEIKELLRLYDCMCAASMNVTGEWYTTQANLDGMPWAATNASMYPTLPHAVITQNGGTTPHRLPTIYKMRLFDPVCFDNSNTAYEAFPYDTDRYETDDCAGVATDLAGNNVFTYISDDMYMTVSEGGVDTVNHNVMLHAQSNFYEEPQNVNNLYIHYEGANVISGVIVLNGDQVITPDTLVIGTHVVQVSFNTARSFSVWIETYSDVPNPPETPTYQEQFYDGTFNFDGTRVFDEFYTGP